MTRSIARSLCDTITKLAALILLALSVTPPDALWADVLVSSKIICSSISTVSCQQSATVVTCCYQWSSVAMTSPLVWRQSPTGGGPTFFRSSDSLVCTWLGANFLPYFREFMRLRSPFWPPWLCANSIFVTLCCAVETCLSSRGTRHFCRVRTIVSNYTRPS